jgi:hypothetical protein
MDSGCSNHVIKKIKFINVDQKEKRNWKLPKVNLMTSYILIQQVCQSVSLTGVLGGGGGRGW